MPRWFLRFFWISEYGDWGTPHVPPVGSNVSLCTLILRSPVLLFWIAVSPIAFLFWLLVSIPHWASSCRWQIKVK